MAFKILTGVIDSTVSCNFVNSYSITRGNRYKLMQKHVHYNLIKFFFANRIVPIWNSLPDYVVTASSVAVFEKRLDYFISGMIKNAIIIGKTLYLESETKV